MKKETKYEYKKCSVPVDVIEKSKKTMPKIGCRTFTAFVTLALTDYIEKIEKNKEV